MTPQLLFAFDRVYTFQAKEIAPQSQSIAATTTSAKIVRVEENG
jgi:hypothetical protein